MDTNIKISLIMNIVIFLILSKKIYTVSHHGKTIIKADESRSVPIFWGVFLFIWGIFLWLNIMLYFRYKNDTDFNFISVDIFSIEVSIYIIITALQNSEIRENGIYGSGNFYKWSKVQSYNWILPNTIQFKVNTFFKTNKSFKFTIKEELKSKVNETVQKYVHS